MKCGKCVQEMQLIRREEEKLEDGKSRVLDVWQCQNKKCSDYAEISKSPGK